MTTEEVGQTAPQNVTTLIGKGDGTFSTVLAGDGSIVPVFGITGDFNGDGLDDVAVSAEYGGVTIFLSGTGGTSTASVTNISPVGTGIHYVDASYPGDGVYSSNLSNTVPLVAEQVPTALTLTNPASASFGQQVTLTATLAPDLAQNHNATGIVSFSSNGAVLGSGNISNGAATLATSALPIGTDTLSASYPGDTNFAASSTTGSITVVATDPPDFSLTGTNITFPVFHSGTGDLELASLNNFSGTIAITCNPPFPPNYTCTLQYPSISLTPGLSSVFTFTLSPTTVASNHPSQRSHAHRPRLILPDKLPCADRSLTQAPHIDQPHSSVSRCWQSSPPPPPAAARITSSRSPPEPFPSPSQQQAPTRAATPPSRTP